MNQKIRIRIDRIIDCRLSRKTPDVFIEYFPESSRDTDEVSLSYHGDSLIDASQKAKEAYEKIKVMIGERVEEIEV